MPSNIDSNLTESWTNNFIQWRGPDKAKNEIHYLDTALLINQYMQEKNLDDISNELSNDKSKAFNDLNKYDKRTLGAIVYCIMTIDTHLNDPQNTVISQAERALLEKLRDALKLIFNDPKNDYTNKINQLLDISSQLVQMDVKSINSKQVTKDICYSIFTTLTLVKTYSNTQSYLTKFALGINNYLISIDNLLTGFKAHIHNLDEAMQSEMKTASAPLPIDTSKSIQQHLNDRFLKIVTDNTMDIESKNKALKKDLNEVNKVLSDIKTEKQQLELIQAKLKHNAQLLSTIQHMDTEVTGIPQFLESMNRSDFKEYLENQDESNALFKINLKELAQVQNQLEEQSTFSKVSEVASSYINWGLSFMVPAEAALDASPPSLNEQCKSKYDQCTKELIQQLQKHQSDLNQNLTVIRQKIDLMETQCANGDPDFKTQLSKQTPAEIDNMIIANQQVLSTVDTFDQYSSQLKSQALELRKIAHYSDSVKKIIHKNDNFLVKISNFFAQALPTIFKQSETAKMVDEAKSIEKQLKKSKYNCMVEMKKSINNICDIKDNTVPFKQTYINFFMKEIKRIQETKADDASELSDIKNYVNKPV